MEQTTPTTPTTPTVIPLTTPEVQEYTKKLENDRKSTTRIIIHCSDSTFGDAAQINHWHIQRGFKAIGYHFVILNGQIVPRKDYDPNLDGMLQVGREESQIGAHCQGYNSDSIGICLIGTDTFTEGQFLTLYSLLLALLENYPDIVEIEGHNFYNPEKPCPNFSVSDYIQNYKHQLLNTRYTERRQQSNVSES